MTTGPHLQILLQIQPRHSPLEYTSCNIPDSGSFLQPPGGQKHQQRWTTQKNISGQLFYQFIKGTESANKCTWLHL